MRTSSRSKVGMSRILPRDLGSSPRPRAEDADEPGTAVRKLIGHSGPVYSVAFNPIGGAAAPPRHLLSASQDGGVRLWSLETWQNLVLYKGHVDPVWDVQWAPLGIHFATASRDRTARLWMTERTAPVRMYAGHLGDVEVSGANRLRRRPR